MRKLRVVVIIAGMVVLALLTTSGRFLMVNQPGRSDIIVVVAGETDRRPALGLELLKQGYAPRMMLDVPAEAVIYHVSQLELAEKYIQGLGQPESISICPIHGLSTRSEAQDVSRCLQTMAAQSVLLATSDYHSRRALSIFTHELAGHDVRVAAVSDEREFGPQWWRHRQWAKRNFDEWARLVWWELVDRWR